MTRDGRHAPARLVSAATALVPAAAAAVAGGVGLTRDSLAESETASVFAARMSFPHLGRLVSHVDLVHATYYAAMHVVVLLGGNVVAMRCVSLAATVAAAAFVAALGRRLSGSATSGLIAGLLFALAPLVDAFAKTVRSYGILPLLVTLTLFALLRGIRLTGRRSAWLPYAAVLLVTVYLHELSLLVLPAFAITLALLRVGRAVWRPWAISSAVVVVLASPLLYFTHREDAAVAWISSPGLRGFATVAHVYGGRTAVSMAIFAVGAVATLVAGVAARVSTDPPGDRWVFAVAWPVALVPPVVLVVESIVAQPLFDYRYVLYYEPAVALAAGHGLARLGRGAVTAAVRAARHRGPAPSATAAGALVVGLAAVTAVLTTQLPALERLTTARAYRGDYGPVSRRIEAQAKSGDGIAYLPASLRYLPDGYPRLRRLDDFALRESPNEAGTFYGKNYSPPELIARLSVLRRVFVVSRPKRHLDPAGRRERAFLNRHFEVHRQWHYGRVRLTLMVRRRD